MDKVASETAGGLLPEKAGRGKSGRIHDSTGHAAPHLLQTAGLSGVYDLAAMIRTGHRPVHPGVALQECTNVLGSLPFFVRTLDFGASELGSVLGKASATLEALRPELRAAFGAMWDREEVMGRRSNPNFWGVVEPP